MPNKQQATEEDEQEYPLIEIPPEKIADPQAYLDASIKVLNASLSGNIPAVDAVRNRDMLKDVCRGNTGIELEDVAREKVDPLLRFRGLIESTRDELEAVQKAVKEIDEIRLSAYQKKKVLKLIDQTISLQDECRADACKFWAYVGRNDDPTHANEVFKFAKCHIEMFDVWNDNTQQHSLIMAPPGHGKSTNLRGQIAWEMGTCPELRHLFITDESKKAAETGLTIKRIVTSRRFRALFPDIRILSRGDKATDSSARFTVCRKNMLARDTTFFAAAVKSRIQGSRFDRIWPDDFCPPEVRTRPAERRDVNNRWNKDIETRLADPSKSRIRMICTPWHPDDPHGRIARLYETGQLPNWRIEIDKFRIKDDPDTGIAIPIWNTDEKGFTEEFFEEMKIRKPTDYDQLYRLRFTSDAKRSVTRLRFYNSQRNNEYTTDADEELLSLIEAGERSLSIDPSATANDQSADTGIIEGVIAKKGEGQEYGIITNAWLLHQTPVEVQDWIVEQIFAQAQIGRPYKYILIEAQGAIKGMVNIWVHTIREKLEEKGCRPIPEFMTPGTRVGNSKHNRGKMARLIECAGYLESGMVRFAGRRLYDEAHNRPILEAVPGSTISRLEEYIIDFDGTNRADGVDATSQWILYNTGRITNPFAKRPPATKTTRAGGKFAKEMERYIKSVIDGYKEKPVSEEEELFWGEGTKGIST